MSATNSHTLMTEQNLLARIKKNPKDELMLPSSGNMTLKKLLTELDKGYSDSDLLKKHHNLQPEDLAAARLYAANLAATSSNSNNKIISLADAKQAKPAPVDKPAQVTPPTIKPVPSKPNEVVRDNDSERIAVELVIAHEEQRDWKVVSVEKSSRGYDLISRRAHPEDPETAVEVRFIEVKGRAFVGDVSLTPNEYKAAERLKHEYWLYVVYNCATSPELHIIQDPVQLGLQPVTVVERYLVNAQSILTANQEQPLT